MLRHTYATELANAGMSLQGLMVLLGHVTQVPVTRSLGAAALVMTSSMLAPIEPLDGAFLGGWKSLAGSVALITLAVLVAVGAL